MQMDPSSNWAEKHRPKTIDEYVFQNPTHEKAFRRFINDQQLSGHLLLSGVQGTGKTAIARVLIDALNVDPMDVMTINASDENSVEVMRDKIKSFIQTFPQGAFKVVLLEEADYISHNGQAVLRKMLEDENNPTRFILTCNYANKLMPALKSRCQPFQFTSADRDDITEMVATVLMKEKIKFDLDLLDQYIAISYPDIRSIFNSVQMSCDGGKLLPLSNENNADDYRFELLPLIEKNQWRQARTLLCKNVAPEEWEGVYRFLYENVTRCFAEDKVEDALILISEHLYYHAIVADPEINGAALIAKFTQL